MTRIIFISSRPLRALHEASWMRDGMRRLRPCLASTAPGRLGQPSGPTTRVCLQWLDAGRMNGGGSRRDQEPYGLRPDPEARSRGAKSPRWSAERRACLCRFSQKRKACAAPRKRGIKVAPFGAPLPHVCEGKGIRAHQSRVYPRLENLDSQIGQGRSGCAGQRIRGAELWVNAKRGVLAYCQASGVGQSVALTNGSEWRGDHG
jgi:hypothetical protein